ncbi:MAG: SPFH domain-containing protein [Christensenellales bacterium]|jgi:membrane protease subunit (stomatin/prohibitin family)|nr:zinc-ribbon domain-containing protein [Clostridiales bacterium]
MSIFNFIKGQLIDVIEWTDSDHKEMAHRFDTGGKEIMMGAQLTVRESQVAIFVTEGRIADVFQPGRYELSTQNLPVLTALKSWKYGFNSPFKSEVYFINTRQFLDLKWGTSNPVMMRDKDFGMIRLRAFGIYSFRVQDPVTFLKEVFGTAAYFTTEGVEGQVKRMIVSSLTDTLAESNIPALDLAANYLELSEQAKEIISPRIAPLGLKLESFVIENISLPQEVEKAMDRRTSMGVAGDLDQYAKYQAAEALRESASNPGMGGMGAGLAGAMMMGKMMNEQLGQSVSSEAKPAAATAACVACRAAIPQGSKFCPVCGEKQEAKAAGFCASCGNPVEAGAKFCPNCGAKQ